MKNPLSPVDGASATHEKTDKEEWGKYEGAENLIHLVDDTFDAFISSGDSVLVMFYAPCRYLFKYVNLNLFLIYSCLSIVWCS
jgi:hypothetical protein